MSSVTTVPYPAGRHPASIARACGVSVRTARRWRAAGQMPAAYALGLALVEDGDLGAVAPDWRGWRLIRGQLFSPDGWGFTPGEIQAAPLHVLLIGELRRQLARPQQFDLLAP